MTRDPLPPHLLFTSLIPQLHLRVSVTLS